MVIALPELCDFSVKTCIENDAQGGKLKKPLISKSTYPSNFVNLCKCSKILDPVKIFAYQQKFQVFLCFVNEMLWAEFYYIDFMRRKNKLNCWTTFLKFQNKYINTLFIYLHFQITYFTFIFNTKNKALG